MNDKNIIFNSLTNNNGEDDLIGNIKLGDSDENKEHLSDNENERMEKEILGGDDYKEEIENESEKERQNKNEEKNCEDKKIGAEEIFRLKGKLMKIKNIAEELLEIISSDSKIQEYESKLSAHWQRPKVTNLDDDAAEIIEGIFNGVKMAAKNGENYDIPANYASKSKLVEGDLLKLRILKNGAFRYKQIDKVERNTLIGKLISDEEGKDFFVEVNDGKKYKVLEASVTYYKADPGDYLSIIVPKSGDSKC